MAHLAKTDDQTLWTILHSRDRLIQRGRGVLQSTQVQLQQTQITLKQTEHRWHQAQTEVAHLQETLAHTTLELDRAQAVILDIESSLFWKVRSLWLMVSAKLSSKAGL
jgi:predicted component of type VI protein secretion system